MTKAAVEEETERFRQYVIASRGTASVGPQAEESLKRLNDIFRQKPELFSEEDKRWLNVLRGYLGQRLAGHRPAVTVARKAKRKGDKLDHCWRCETPIDERFVEMCPDCSEKAYQWRVCPVCKACGCQRAGKLLV